MPNGVFVVKGIKPNKLKVKEVRLEILNALRAEGRDVVKELRKTTATWSGEKPDFEAIIGLSGEDASVFAGPTGSEMGAKKWRWLDAGTRIRWALMSRDWRSKTRPGFVGSGPGAGRVLLAGRRAMTRRNIAPRPGIQARGWSELIQKRRKRKFRDRIIAAKNRGLKKGGW